ncbi:twin arginine-targeting protein translocase, TatA/E family [Caldisphaera lagunensis DSM 15908]|uniref:Twin arginine-targeting protein translocase, TatA/E family n=1 Tax=Caldisphaera lagunensis (strain DSM 15908 / JCM 11604 / ANMR 0165 / IC-154) TaxID=1056495 RepID=L0ADC6_CALLD|nr:twin-arginine translocase TatA/TatE family subunit [Caldisphaera lagunensis]AFZ71055.1 twin arginine-targeting protein translocase, TatA/E family [Caldisphaera lagunensis DSM 15908]
MLDSLIDWLIVIVVIAILFGGATKIPEIARALGRAVGEFKKGQMEVEKELKESINNDKAKKDEGKQ